MGDGKLYDYVVRSRLDEEYLVDRSWMAEDADHAREQHEDALPEEEFIDAWLLGSREDD